MGQVMRLMSRLVAVAWLCVQATLCPPRLQAAERDDNVIETFDVARDGDVLLVPVAIGDREYRFMLDTAASITTVDKLLESQLEPTGWSSDYEGKNNKIYRLMASLVGESHLPIEEETAFCLDFTRSRGIYGHDLHGILGMSFLKSHVIRVDFDAGKLSFLKRAPASAGSQMPLFYDANERPRLKVEFDDDETIAFVPDLTNPRSDLTLKGFHVDELVEQGRLSLRAPPAWSWTLGSETLDRGGRLDRFRLSEFVHDQVTVRESSYNSIGLSLLSRYVVTFDFPNGRMYLDKGKRFAEPHRSDLSGMTVTRLDGETRIGSVRPDTPADACGLKSQDEILQVNGNRVSALSLHELRSRLMVEGARIRLDVTGPAGRRRVELQLPNKEAPALTPAAVAVSARDDETARDAQNIVFEGATSFDAEQIKNRLSLDIDFQTACHPSNPWSNYLRRLEELLVTGYRTSGFPKAHAQARFDAKRRQVSVRVHEGQRYRCSRVQVTGLGAHESSALVTELTQEVPPAFAIPIVVTRDDGTTRTVWETEEGKEANPAKPVWKIGEPASFDKSLAADVGARLMQWFWVRGRVLAVYHIEVRVEEGSDGAILDIAVDDPGVPATIGQIEIEGARINSAQDVLKFLAIRPGMPFDAHIELQLDRRMWESGRLIRGYIKKSTPVRTQGGASVNLKVIISEHPRAAPLNAPLEPCEKALLKLRDWVMNWSEGVYDDELMADLVLNPSNTDESNAEARAEPSPVAKTYEIRVVTSPRNGQVISAQIKQAGKNAFAQTFIARDQRAIVYSPLNATHLESPLSNKTQLKINIALLAVKPHSAIGRGMLVNFGLGVKSLSSGTSTALALKLDLAPLAVLLGGNAFANVECKSEAGMISIRADGVDIQLDERTGRPVHFQVSSKEFGTLHCRTGRGALRQEFDRQELLMADSQNVYDLKRPESSLAAYFIGESARLYNDRLTSEQQQSLAALLKLIRNWSIEPVSELLSDSGGDVNLPEAFCLPKKQVQWAHPALSVLDFDGAGTTAGYLLPIYQKLVPHSGWLWPVGRDSLFALIGRPMSTWEDIGQDNVVIDSGPLGHLTTALALSAFSGRASQKLANQGAKRLSAKAFQDDCAPLLAGDSWLGRNVLSLAEALRGLEAAEIEALVRLFADKSHRREIADSLLLLKADSKSPVRDVMLEVCEQLWQTSVRRTVETALENLSGRKSTGTSALIQDFKFDPFKSEPEKPDVKDKPTLRNQPSAFDFKIDLKDEDFKIGPAYKPK